MTEQFEAFKQQYPATSGLNAIRLAGLQQFEKLGLPTRKNEAWHYTSLKDLRENKFTLALLGPAQQISKNKLALYNPEFYNIVFVDGRLDKSMSDISLLGGEIEIAELQNTQIVAAPNSAKKNPLEALNQSYLQQGLSITLRKNSALNKPLQVISIVTEAERMVHPFLLVALEENSKLSLIESFESLRSSSWQNSVASIKLARGSKLEYLRLQTENQGSYNTGSSHVELSEDSSLESLSFTVGAKLGRHDLSVDLIGKNASARLHGLTVASHTQHLDHNTVIDHRVGQCTTSQLYKSVLDAKARSVFTGMVKIQQGAQKASSEQLNNNLLLSREAEADSRPQLEILADDVKATHGSTVGQLNPEELFYLLSRAIPREQAIEMLSLGFVQDLVYQVSEPRIQKWLLEVLVRNYRQSIQLKEVEPNV